MRHLFFIAVLGFLIFLLTGCAGMVDSIRETSTKPQGCTLAQGSFDGTYTSSGYGFKRVNCSKELPPGFSFSYDDNQTKISIVNPPVKVDPVVKDFADKLHKGTQ